MPPPLHRQNRGSTPRAEGYSRVKALTDRSAASVLLLFVTPVLIVLVALVRLTSRGPGLFRQVRVGLNGRTFTIYKLRTMSHDCERASGPCWSAPGDPRVTRLGLFLRKTHLDELPQLWNVVCGEMSLVGPRPERPEFVSDLVEALPRYAERLMVPPGITGLAQVQLPPDTSVGDVRRKLSYDLHYVDRMGAVLDGKILAATALKMLGVRYDTIGMLLDLPNPETRTPSDPTPAAVPAFRYQRPLNRPTGRGPYDARARPGYPGPA